ncbi:hypothetical protein MHY85_05255 [Cellulomonas sp. ACRRI]|uniref:hypothetical protein n=1 Tax=Cellulomonas sp. ACRRI TaxID=2918188 RepID=UPI001EF1DACF|nr:hypothetical protein [Cellulomonas sp. ACRRI]MCG7285383.1 hypothetical protein [Cellulomonas sp. ACRRI]
MSQKAKEAAVALVASLQREAEEAIARHMEQMAHASEEAKRASEEAEWHRKRALLRYRDTPQQQYERRELAAADMRRRRRENRTAA